MKIIATQRSATCSMRLTNGKTYDVIEWQRNRHYTTKHMEHSYKVMDDAGEELWTYWPYVVELEEWRQNQLAQLGI